MIKKKVVILFVIIACLLIIGCADKSPLSDEEIIELPEDDPAKKLSTVGKNIVGQAYGDLTSEQKRAFWGCWRNSCHEKLKQAQEGGSWTEYISCSQGCFATAEGATVDFCEDSDGKDYKNKGVVTTDDYLGGPQYDCTKVGDKYECSDSCYTFSNGKEYLIEMKCGDNKPSYVQKNCNELGDDYSCVEGACVKSSCGISDWSMIPKDEITEDQVRYLFEVLLHGGQEPWVFSGYSYANGEKFTEYWPYEGISEVSHWDPEGCQIPIYFSKISIDKTPEDEYKNVDFDSWNTPGRIKIQEILDKLIPQLTGGKLTPIYINEDSEMSANYKDIPHLTIQSFWKKKGTTTREYNQIGEWKGTKLFDGEAIDNGWVTLPKSWFTNPEGIEEWEIIQLRRSIARSMGHENSYQVKAFMGSSYDEPTEWEQEVNKMFYSLPVGTHPQEIWDYYNVDSMGIDPVNEAPMIELVHKDDVVVAPWTIAQAEGMEFIAGEEIYVYGKRLTSARGCYGGMIIEPPYPDFHPKVFIGEHEIPVQLPQLGGLCKKFSVTIPEEIPSGEYDLKVFVREKWSNTYPVKIVSNNNPSTNLACNNENINAVYDLPDDEDQLRFFFEVLLGPNIVKEDTAIREVTRWGSNDCLIPIYFEQGWDTAGGNKVKEVIEENFDDLTGGLYMPLFLNENPDLLEEYQNKQITIKFISGTTGKAITSSDEVGQWNGKKVFDGHEITQGEFILPIEWMNNPDIIDEDKERTIIHELGHSLGYRHSWQVDSFMSQSTIDNPSMKVQEWEKQLLNIFYRLPIGTSPETISNMLDLQGGGENMVNSPAVIYDTYESSFDSEFWPSLKIKTTFSPGETMHLSGRRMTSGRYCVYGSEFDSDVEENSPTIYIDDVAIPISLPLLMPAPWDETLQLARPSMCIKLPVKIPDTIEPGEKEIKVFVRGKWSDPYSVTIEE